MITDNDILEMLRAQPGIKGREVGSRLNADKTEVNYWIKCLPASSR